MEAPDVKFIDPKKAGTKVVLSYRVTEKDLVTKPIKPKFVERKDYSWKEEPQRKRPLYIPPLIPQMAQSGGLFILSPSGGGKSTLIKQVIEDNRRAEVPSFVFDIQGSLTNQALDTGDIYVSSVGYEDQIVPFPFLNRHEEAYEQTQRVADLLEILSPELKTAPISGLSRGKSLLTAGLEALIFMELPIFFLDSLLRDPKKYMPRLEGMELKYQKSYHYLHDFAYKLRPQEQLTWSEPLLNRLSPLFYDLATISFSNAPQRRVNWNGTQSVFVDFSGIEGKDAQAIKLMWIWTDLMRHLKSRSYGDRPVSIIIDELANFSNHNIEVIAQDIEKIVTQYKRNGNIFFVAATQDLSLLPERMQKVMMNLSNFMIGRVTNPEVSKELSRRFFPTDPLITKEAPIGVPNETEIKADLLRPIDEQTLRHEYDLYADSFAGVNSSTGKDFYNRKHLFDIERGRQVPGFNGDFSLVKNIVAVPKPKNPQYLSTEDQVIENSKAFQRLNKFEWLQGISEREGEPARTLEFYKQTVTLQTNNVVRIKRESTKKYGVEMKTPQPLKEPVSETQQQRPKEQTSKIHAHLDHTTEQTMSPQAITRPLRPRRKG